jgi:hypothetical protein
MQADGAGEKGERDEPRAMPSALHESTAQKTSELSKGEVAASGEPSMLSRPHCMASHHTSHQADIEQGHKEVEVVKDQRQASASAHGEKPKPLTLKANKGFLKGLPQPKPKKQKTGEWSSTSCGCSMCGLTFESDPALLEEESSKPKSKYLREMETFQEQHCGDDSNQNGRPLVK